MWTAAVVVGGVLVQNGCQVTFTGDEHPVGAFAADGADPALSVRVRAGRPRRGVEHVDALAGEHRIERGGEFVVAVAEQEPQPGRASVEVHQQIPCLLGDPGTGRVGGDPGDVDLARADLDEEQHVDPFKEHGVDGEEVAGQDRVRLRGEELFPGGPGTAWCRVDASPVEDIPHRAGRYLVAQADQLTVNSSMPPQRVLGSQPQHQLADLLGDRRRPRLACGYVQCRAISARCQRSRVAGVTKNADQRGRGSSRDKAASTTRSAGSRAGRCTCRRSTAIWWRSTNSSTSLAPPSRASWVNICSTWRSSRYTNEALMASIVPIGPASNGHNTAGQRSNRVSEPDRPNQRIRSGSVTKPTLRASDASPPGASHGGDGMGRRTAPGISPLPRHRRGRGRQRNAQALPVLPARTGSADDELRLEDDVPMLMAVGVGDFLQQQLRRCAPELLAGLAHRRERYRGCGGELDVVVPDDRDVFRYAYASAGHLLKHAQREQVVGAEHRRGPVA